MKLNSSPVPFRSSARSIEHELSRVDENTGRFSVCIDPHMAQLAFVNPLGFRQFKNLSAAVRRIIETAKDAGWAVTEERSTVTFFDESVVAQASLADYETNEQGYPWVNHPISEITDYLAQPPNSIRPS